MNGYLVKSAGGDFTLGFVQGDDARTALDNAQAKHGRDIRLERVGLPDTMRDVFVVYTNANPADTVPRLTTQDRAEADALVASFLAGGVPSHHIAFSK